MGSEFRILLVEDSPSFRGAVSQLLGVYNEVDEASDLASARSALAKSSYDVAILDKGLPDGNGMTLISEVKNLYPNAVVIVLTSDEDFSSVKRCIALGADDYVVKSESVVPDLLVRIPVAVSKAASSRRLASLEQQVRDAFRYEIVGKSLATTQLRESVLSLKGTSAPVLITGESGTGKELVARRLHAIEDDGKRPFVAVNCGAIPESLLESELFGHKKGAFTGALQDRPGRFELANGGDLFLDEIGEMPLAAQVKLLRVIQEGEVERVGDNRTIKVRCRVIAATNCDLEAMIASGRFREDLFHRLNVIGIGTTPLRIRPEDIKDLAASFVLQIAGPMYKISDPAVRALESYSWPGNIRELRNAIERAVISVRKRKSHEIGFDDVIIQPANRDASYQMRKLEASLPKGPRDITPEKFQDFMDAIAREYFRAASLAMDGRIGELATRIGVSRSTAFKRMKDLGLLGDEPTARRTHEVSRPKKKSRQSQEMRSEL